MNLLTQSAPTPAVVAQPMEDVAALLDPLYDAARDSSSLLANSQVVELSNRAYTIPKFLLLGQRGGGKPIRIALFAGLDAGAIDTTVALSRLLLQFELNPALARDYALFGYPIVNVRGFDEEPQSLRAFEARYAKDGLDEDVRFFRSQLRSWQFDGLVSLRLDPKADAFSATSRSKVLADEVVQPSLEAIAATIPVSVKTVRLRAADRYARLADHAHGKLTALASEAPFPFEIEVFAPGSIPVEQRVTGLFLTVHEILRNYRRLISHGQNL